MRCKGNMKEAVGALTGDKKLKARGKLDEATGKVKQAVVMVLGKARKTTN